MGFKDWFRPRVQQFPPDEPQPQQQPRQRKRRGEPRRTNKSAISPLTLVAIQGSLTGADGLVSGPTQRPGQKGFASYVQGMVTPPKRARISVVAVRRDDEDTVVTVVISTNKGDQVSEHASPNVLWNGNIRATAATIAGTLLQIPGQQSYCESQLAELVASPVGSAKKFTLGAGNRLMVTKGED